MVVASLNCKAFVDRNLNTDFSSPYMKPHTKMEAGTSLIFWSNPDYKTNGWKGGVQVPLFVLQQGTSKDWGSETGLWKSTGRSGTGNKSINQRNRTRKHKRLPQKQAGNPQTVTEAGWNYECTLTSSTCARRLPPTELTHHGTWRSWAECGGLLPGRGARFHVHAGLQLTRLADCIGCHELWGPGIALLTFSCLLIRSTEYLLCRTFRKQRQMTQPMTVCVPLSETETLETL